MKKIIVICLSTVLLSSCLIIHVPHKGNCGLPKYNPPSKHHRR